jgi:hypothetical protein
MNTFSKGNFVISGTREGSNQAFFGASLISGIEATFITAFQRFMTVFNTGNCTCVAVDKIGMAVNCENSSNISGSFSCTAFTNCWCTPRMAVKWMTIEWMEGFATDKGNAGKNNGSLHDFFLNI